MENKINIYEEKFTSVLRIFFLTFWMTFFVTLWKVWMVSWFMKVWLQTWAMVFLGVIIIMCFIVSPFVLDLFKLKGNVRQITGLLILTFIFAFVFSYRFDTESLKSFNFIYLKTILINWWVLILIVFPFWMLVAWPLAKYLHKKLV